jgi:superfamily II RNA helicase
MSSETKSYFLHDRAQSLLGLNESSKVLDSFLEYVDREGIQLYEAQEEAIMNLFDGKNVILNTPTGSGKSLVALAVQFLSLCQNKRSYYTAPVKALVNEKFLALCRVFGPDQVGLITGDASVNSDAPIVCCTAEILANLALRKGENCEIAHVIIDEFHYYSDRERGVAWQIPLIVLSKTRFLIMSATLGDVSFFEKGLTGLNGFATVTVSSSHRPVPLNFSYETTPLQETILGCVTGGRSPIYLVSFSQRQAAEEAQNLMSIDICSKDEKKAIKEALANVRFNSPYGKEIQKLLHHGIGIHHAGLLPRYRLAVEGLAQRGLLKVISGTDTLGVGVNVPIRTVLFTQLCKFDGQKTAITSVRDFKQIAGRAGRKGFDDQGYVIAQAPEHVIENLKLEAKAGNDPKKAKKIVKRKPPEKGFVLWTKETFEKLRDGNPEPLVSRFLVNHGMVLNVLARESGCESMRSLIKNCHETDLAKEKLRRHAFQIFRSLVERGIIQFENHDGRLKKSLKLNVDLQQDFSLHQTLSLFLIDTLPVLNKEDPEYALNMLTLCESIVENPDAILRKQLDKVKSEKMAQMKQDGVEFEERIAELEKLEYPKPLRDFIYDQFNSFSATHPWVGQENIRPKSIVREMFEKFMTFAEYVREYGLERSEGVLMRSLTEVYRVLVKTVPSTYKTEELIEIESYLGGILRQVDSTLLDEWEGMKKGSIPVKNDPVDLKSGILSSEKEQFDITKSRKEFVILVRNEIFQFVKALNLADCNRLFELVKDADFRQAWPYERVKSSYFEFWDSVQGLDLKESRNSANFKIADDHTEHWKVSQTLCDVEGNNEWSFVFALDIAKSRQSQSPVVQLEALIRSI